MPEGSQPGPQVNVVFQLPGQPSPWVWPPGRLVPWSCLCPRAPCPLPALPGSLLREVSHCVSPASPPQGSSY